VGSKDARAAATAMIMMLSNCLLGSLRFFQAEQIWYLMAEGSLSGSPRMPFPHSGSPKYPGSPEPCPSHQRIRDVMTRLDNEKMYVGKA
jgi:hypothetical protein